MVKREECGLYNRMASPKNSIYESLEKEVNKLLGFSDTRGSGASLGNGDGISKKFMVETKIINTESLSFTKKDWNKLVSQARNYNKIPIYSIVRKNKDNWSFLSLIETKVLGNLLKPKDISNEVEKVIYSIIDELYKIQAFRKSLKYEEIEKIIERIIGE